MRKSKLQNKEVQDISSLSLVLLMIVFMFVIYALVELVTKDEASNKNIIPQSKVIERIDNKELIRSSKTGIH